jgi:multiple sugar transport system substrate-binding protein
MARKLTRRQFLKGAVSTGTVMAGGVLVPRKTWPQAKPTVNMLMRSHFIPDYDKWVRGLADEFERQKGIRVTTDHIAQTELGPRLTSEIAAKRGHDVVELMTPFSLLPLYEDQLADVSDVAEDLAKRHGGWLPIAKDYCLRGTVWKGILNYYIDYASCYRRDLMQKLGIERPKTWDEVLKAGRELKKAGNPMGMAISHSADANASCTMVLWAFGSSWVAQDGKTVTLKSPNTTQALEFAKQLYDDTMTPEVLAWDDAGNNRFMISGRGSWTLNAASVYYAGMKSNPDIGKNIYHSVPPTGPTGLGYNYSLLNAFGIWQFSPNVGPAKQWLTYFMDRWMDGYKVVAGYNYPPLAAYAKPPMPIINDIPNLKDLQGIPAIARGNGFPGPMTVAAGEVNAEYIIPDMFTKVVSGGKVSEAIAWAEEQVLKIYRKHYGSGVKTG